MEAINTPAPSALQKNLAIRARIQAAFDARPGLRVGDFVRWPNGEVRRCRRAWYFTLPCRVFRLEPFAMNEQQARAHPLARQSAEFWGANSRGHKERLQELMDPPVLRNPDYY